MLSGSDDSHLITPRSNKDCTRLIYLMCISCRFCVAWRLFHTNCVEPFAVFILQSRSSVSYGPLLPSAPCFLGFYFVAIQLVRLQRDHQAQTARSGVMVAGIPANVPHLCQVSCAYACCYNIVRLLLRKMSGTTAFHLRVAGHNRKNRSVAK